MGLLSLKEMSEDDLKGIAVISARRAIRIDRLQEVLKRVALYLRDEAESSEPMRDPATHMELSVAIKDATRQSE